MLLYRFFGMVIGAVLGALKIIFKKPQVVLPLLFAAIINVVLLSLFFDAVFDFLYDAFVLGNIPSSGLWELPFAVFASYPSGVILIILLSFVSAVVQFWAVFALAKFVKDLDGKGGIVSAVKAANKRIYDVLGISVFLSAVFALYSLIFLFLVWLIGLAGIFALVLILLWVLFGVWLFIKLFLLAIVSAAEKLNTRDAIGKTWLFAEKHFLGIIAIIIVAGIIVAVIEGVGTAIADWLNLDIFSDIISIIFILFAQTFSQLAFILYYLKSRK